jgi:hypothetical protein
VFVRFLTNKEWILRKSSPRLPGVSHDTIARGELALKRKHIIAAKAKENQFVRFLTNKEWTKELAKICPTTLSPGENSP